MPSITLTADWQIAGAVSRLRSEILAGLRAAEFTITSEMNTIVEAQRGSSLAGALRPGKIPLAATVWFSPGDPVCGARLLLADRSVSAASLGMNAAIDTAFREILGAIDQRLAPLDPSAGPFPDAMLWTRTGGSAPFLRGPAGPPMPALPGGGGPRQGAGGGRGLAGFGNALLGGRQKNAAVATTPSAWSHVSQVVFTNGEQQAVVGVDEVRTFLGIAAMIASEPKSLPPEPAAKVASFAAIVEMGIASAVYGIATIDVPEENVATLVFLVRQARIRAELPARILRTCVDCGQTKVMDPVYQQAQTREKNLGDLMSVATAVFGSSQKNLVRIANSLVHAGQHRTDFVCTRCQCTKPPKEQPVTFCPHEGGCGDMRKDAVLLMCRKCKYDFRKLLPQMQLWTKGTPPPRLSANATAAELGEVPTMTAVVPMAPFTSAEPMPAGAGPASHPAAAPPPPAMPPMSMPPMSLPPLPVPPQPPGPQVSWPPTPMSPQPPGPQPPGPQPPAMSQPPMQSAPQPPAPASAPPPPAYRSPSAMSQSAAPPPAGPPPHGSVPSVPSHLPPAGPPHQPPVGAAAPQMPLPPLAGVVPPQRPSGPVRAPGGGKVCQICGMTFPSLWLVHVSVAAGITQPMYVCASTPRCSPPSASAPTRV